MFDVKFSSSEDFTASFSQEEDHKVSFGEHTEVPVTEWFEGPYEITPGEEQTLECKGLVSLHDIVIKAVPSGYGKIAWNGSFLTVS